MKKIFECKICGRAVPRTLAYEAEVERGITSPMTGETSYTTVQGLICPLCNRDAGYKGSKEKLERFDKEV